MSDVIERLKARCTGHPNAHIPWPHYELHDAIAEIERLRAAFVQINQNCTAVMVPSSVIEAIATEALTPTPIEALDENN